MIAININVTRIDKTALYAGKNGKYLSLTLHENRDGKDQYGNDGFVTQDIGKERRQAGEKGPILGNYKTIGQASPPSQDAHNQSKANGYAPQLPSGRQASPGMPHAPPQTTDDEEDDIPF